MDFENYLRGGHAAATSPRSRARSAETAASCTLRTTGTSATPPRSPSPGLRAGAFARRVLGDGYLAVGTFFGTGRFQAYDRRSGARDWDGPRWRAFETGPPAGGVREALFLATGLDAFALDLARGSDERPRRWTGSASLRPVRNIGNSYDLPDAGRLRRGDTVLADVVRHRRVLLRHADRAVPTAAEVRRGSYDLGTD